MLPCLFTARFAFIFPYKPRRFSPVVSSDQNVLLFQFTNAYCIPRLPYPRFIILITLGAVTDTSSFHRTSYRCAFGEFPRSDIAPETDHLGRFFVVFLSTSRLL